MEIKKPQVNILFGKPLPGSGGANPITYPKKSLRNVRLFNFIKCLASIFYFQKKAPGIILVKLMI